MSKIISTIPDILTERKVSIAEFSRKTGLSYRTARGLATGQASRFGLDTLDAVCDALGIKPSELFKYPAKRKPRKRTRPATAQEARR